MSKIITIFKLKNIVSSAILLSVEKYQTPIKLSLYSIMFFDSFRQSSRNVHATNGNPRKLG